MMELDATNDSQLPRIRWSDELSHALISRTLASIDRSSMSRQAYSELVDYINYDSHLSPCNINRYLATQPPVQLQPPSYIPYYPQLQPPSYIPYPIHQYNNVGRPPAVYPQQSHAYSPMYYPMQQQYYNPVRPPLSPAYDDPVTFVDGVAIIFEAVERTDDYEDLLHLQERVGRVNVGLSKETIFKNLKTSQVVDVASKDKEEGGELCAVCQDEYKVKETIGTLQCGHRYHANCIKEWLLRKNECPICKAKALIT